MNLDEFEYAKKYISEGAYYFRKLRRLIELTEQKYDIVTNISPGTNFSSEIFYDLKPDYIENALTEMIDSKNLCNDTFHKCVDYCKPLMALNDETGSEILFYYYFLKVSITDISNQLYVGRKTCYRHLNKAISQLDSYLKESGQYNIKGSASKYKLENSLQNR